MLAFDEIDNVYLDMNSGSELAARLSEVFLDGRWIAHTNYADQLQHIDVHLANKKVGDINSIALLTYHIHYYVAGILQALDTGELTIRDQYSFDMPVLKNADDWRELVKRLEDNSKKLIDRVEGMTDQDLEQVFFHEKYGTYRRNFEALIEHAYYHLGQLVLVRKLVEAREHSFA